MEVSPVPYPVPVDPGGAWYPVPVEPATPVPGSGPNPAFEDFRQPQPARGRPSGPKGQGASRPKM